MLFHCKFQVIQVTYELNEQNFERELLPLAEAAEELPKTDLLLITYDREDVIEFREKTIKVLPAWKWFWINKPRFLKRKIKNFSIEESGF